ncbi:glycoside hydrolase family 16 protein [Stemphylium lycopersici]|nr:glycoside hydrolase family 16 protein [Stemphylium lycopersici]RAR08580.1 glycoside hydrolase family 16 protein [Stemphylium lycopersici]
MRFSTLTSAAAFFQMSIAGYVLEDDYMTDFYGAFNFFTEADPTEGFVQYVDEDTARQTNLINASVATGASWGVDTQNECPEGRPSIRIESKKTYDSGLIVLDVAHMPFGCGTWPAFWTTGPNWPKNGEIDIIEGVNDQTNNGMTLHTGPGCQIGSDTTQFAGSVTTGNCDVAAEDQKENAGCSIEHPSTKSYGAGLNEIGGGVYATQWTADAISVYFFPRDSIPQDILGDSPDPSGWGKPAAKFEGGCDIADTFKQQQIVFDTTFCGQWAGSQDVWESGTCGQKADTCEEWVKNNPEAFADAYWTINSLKVYQDNGEASYPAPSSAPAQSSAAYVPEPVPTEAPAVSSAIVEPTQYPAKPTSLIIPSVSGIFAPIPTSETASAPVASPPADNVAPSAPAETPSATETPEAAPIAPSTPVAAPAPAPTGAGGMTGFHWPQGGAGDSNDTAPTSSVAASPPESTGALVPSSSDADAAPSETQSVVQPSNAPAVSNAPAAPEAPAPAPTDAGNAPVAAPAVPVVTDTVQAVKTIYETVYATVTAGAGATPAPAPAPRNVRMARYIREHRQRLTRHHAKH